MYSKKRNRQPSSWVNLFFLIAVILGLLSINQTSVQADAISEQDDPELLEIKQGSFIHQSIQENETLIFNLDVKSPESSVYYYWEIPESPLHGEVSIESEGSHASVEYIPENGFTGEDSFNVSLTDSTGKEAETSLIITIESQPTFIEFHNIPDDSKLDFNIINERSSESDPQEIKTPHNQTNNSISVSDPYIEVRPEWDYLTGYNWSPNTEVTLTIGSNQWTAETDDYGWVWFNLPPFDIQAGQVLEMTDGTYTLTYTIANLTVTVIDEAADTISGTADPNSDVSVSAENDVSGDTISVTADGLGDWQADFSASVDIAPGSHGYAWQYDVEGNSTKIHWYISDPWIVVYPQWDEIYGYDWSPNTEVTLMIGTNQWTAETDTDGQVYFDTYPFDLEAGQVLEMTDSTYTRTHTITNVSVTEIDEAADTVSGTADPNSDVSVSANNDVSGDTISVTADGSGDWQADFSGSVDIGPDSYGYARQYDAEGNSTRIYWYVPDPRISTYPVSDYLYGYKWSQNAEITLTIGPNQWTAETDTYGWVYFNTSPFDLQAGQVVMMTDGTYTRTYTITNLAITEVDEAADIVSGTADPNSDVSVYAENDVSWIKISLTADGSGNWQADFSGSVDIVPGSYGYAQQYDDEDNSTNIRWYIPDPWIDVYPQFDYLYGYEWSSNAEITLTIGANQWTTQTSGTGYVYFDLYPFDLQAGQVLDMTDGTSTLTYTVTNLTVTEIDEAADTISGTADPGSDLYIYAYDGYDYEDRNLTADGSGFWQADFSGAVDLAPGSSGYAWQYDTEGNYTNIYWYIPDPSYSVYIETDVVIGTMWSPNADVTLTIENNQWTQKSSAMGEIYFNVRPFDILPGQQITLTDGCYTLTYTPWNISITNIDFDADVIYGIAQSIGVTTTRSVSNEVWVQACDNSGCFAQYVTPDASGCWSADFSGTLDVELGTTISIEMIDEQGNSTIISRYLRRAYIPFILN